MIGWDFFSSPHFRSPLHISREAYPTSAFFRRVMQSKWGNVQLFKIIILLAVAVSHGYEACDLKESNRTFLYIGVEWACNKYCPKIRGCLKQCCPKTTKANSTAETKIARSTTGPSSIGSGHRQRSHGSTKGPSSVGSRSVVLRKSPTTGTFGDGRSSNYLGLIGTIVGVGLIGYVVFQLSRRYIRNLRRPTSSLQPAGVPTETIVPLINGDEQIAENQLPDRINDGDGEIAENQLPDHINDGDGGVVPPEQNKYEDGVVMPIQEEEGPAPCKSTDPIQGKSQVAQENVDIRTTTV